MLRCCVGRDARETLQRVARQQERTGSHGDPAVLLAQENMVVGEVDEVAARLRAYAAAGVERVFLQHLDYTDLEMVRLIGEEIAPAVG